MNYRVFSMQSASSKEFVSFWSALYVYPDADLYDSNIGKPLNEERVWQLYRWKNGTSQIAEKKKQSIRSIYIAALADLPDINNREDGKRYVAGLSGGGIWDIFWLHCLAPRLFPIFDQHTYRAMAHIKGLALAEIETARPRKIAAYFDRFLSFVDTFEVDINRRDLDKALFAYGRFLKSDFSTSIVKQLA